MFAIKLIQAPLDPDGEEVLQVNVFPILEILTVLILDIDYIWKFKMVHTHVICIA